LGTIISNVILFFKKKNQEKIKFPVFGISRKLYYINFVKFIFFKFLINKVYRSLDVNNNKNNKNNNNNKILFFKMFNLIFFNDQMINNDLKCFNGPLTF
jgi:hypothetical protein